MEHAVSAMSISHTIGNVTSFIVEYLKGLYPPNYFKRVTVVDTIAYRYFNAMENLSSEFIRSKNPKIIIRPRLDVTEGETFLKGTYLTSRITDNYMDLDFGNLQPFFSDRTNGNHIKYLMNRLNVNYDITMIFETQTEQINQAIFLRNRVRQDHPFFIDTALESNIPMSLMRVLAKEANINMVNIPKLMKYINSHSCYPVTYKMKNSSGNDEFFRYYPAQLDTTFTNFSIDDGGTRGMVRDGWAINFTITTEFYTSGLYYYFTKKKGIIDEIRMDIQADNGNSIIPIFTVSNLFDVPLPTGWEVFTQPMFKVSHEGRPDELDIDDILDTTIKTMIEYHHERGLSVSNFIGINILKDNEKLEMGKDYTVDYRTNKITINKTNMTSTYRLIIYVNTLYINDLVSTLHNIRKEK